MQVLRQLVMALAARVPADFLSGRIPTETTNSLVKSEPNGAEIALKSETSPQAIVLWHGLGDHYDSDGMTHVIELISQMLPGAFIHSIYVDSNPSLDERKSVFGNANAEVDLVCEQLKNITELSHGFGAIGFSQGGLFLRALIERCSVSVSTLITFGSPHMGVSELPVCQPKDDWVCKQRNEFLKRQVWQDSVQKQIVPAQYFRDTKEYDKYLQHSNFLADINNERETVDSKAKERFERLQKLVLVQFDEDSTLVPRESAFFQERHPNTGNILPISATRIFKENLFGLRTLYEQEKIDFHRVEDEHMRFSDEFLSTIVAQYFAGQNT